MEVYKSAVGEEGVDMLLDLFQKKFEQEKMAEELRHSVISHTFKEEGASMIVLIIEATIPYIIPWRLE